MNQGAGSQIVGGIFTGLLGILIIGGIYQLNKPNTPIVPTAGQAYSSTLSAIFK